MSATLALQGLTLLIQAAPTIANLVNTDQVTASQLATDDAAEQKAHQDLLDAINAAKSAGY